MVALVNGECAECAILITAPSTSRDYLVEYLADIKICIILTNIEKGTYRAGWRIFRWHASFATLESRGSSFAKCDFAPVLFRNATAINYARRARLC